MGLGLHFQPSEVRMLLYARSPATRLYTVEISGWDGQEEFFVERCELEWNEESGKRVALKRALSNHAILLVRLMQTGDSECSRPVVYEAELIGKTKSGLHQFRLNVVAPHLREKRARCPTKPRIAAARFDAGSEGEPWSSAPKRNGDPI